MSGFREAYRTIPIGRGTAPQWSLPDRLPPHNAEAERSLLGSILLDDSVMPDVLELIDVPHFYREIHQRIFQAMKDCFEEGQAIDAVTLGDRLEVHGVDEDEDINGLLDEIVKSVPHSANAKYYAGIVKEKAEGRSLVDVFCQGINLAYSNTKTAPEILEWAIGQVTSIKVDDAARDEAALHPLPDRMGDPAFHGIAGEIVNAVSPQTEACRESILGQLLVAFGNVIGPRPHWRVDATVHRCNLFLCLVGPTGIARKGTSWDVARWLIAKCEPEWGEKPVLSGLTSGEGLIEQVEENDGTLLAVESEFARLLTNASREHSSLSTVLRQAWDGSHLRVATRNKPLHVGNAYFSLIGHMTVSDLRAKLSSNDLENGMANRFLWMSVYRDGELPEGGDFDSVATALGPLIPRLQKAIDFARLDKAFDRPVKKTAAAKSLWRDLYHGELARAKTGHYAQVTVRAAPLILRLALIYTVLDRSRMIDVAHIEAGRAFWDYCDATAAHLFGNPQNDGDLGKLIELLKKTPAGLTKGEINRRAFSGKIRASALDELLAQAQGSGQILRGSRPTAGGTKVIWLYRGPVR